MIALYKASPLRSRFNAFSRVLRAALHDSLFPAADAGTRRTVHALTVDGDSCEVHSYRGRLKICPSSGLVFEDDVLLKNSSDLFMRERVPDYARIYRQHGRHIPELISLRHGAERNYWHFFQLVATKAVIADRFGFDRRIPLLLSRRQAEVPFIARMLERNFQDGRPVVIQEPGEVIASDTVHTVLPALHGGGCRDLLLDRLGVTGQAGCADRVFVTRGRQAENDRTLLNQNEVGDALAGYGFVAIDPQNLDLDRQIEVFSRCGFMVSPHGAGLTNIIFRRGAPLEILEIFNHNLVNDCYRIAAHHYGFGYRAMICREVAGKPTSGNARVDIAELSAMVESMLAERPGRGPQSAAV